MEIKEYIKVSVTNRLKKYREEVKQRWGEKTLKRQ